MILEDRGRGRAFPPLLALAILAGCSGSARTPGSVGSRAPSYRALSVTGDSASLESERGHAVLLNVWATWCEPCREEMPALEAAHRAYGPRGLRVIGVSIDPRGGDVDVHRFVERHDITFAILRDPDDRVSGLFRLPGVPCTLLIDRNGVITGRWIGPFDPTSAENRTKLREALAEPA